MIRIEWDPTGRTLVTGALVGESARLQQDEISRGWAVLDLSGVDRVRGR